MNQVPHFSISTTNPYFSYSPEEDTRFFHAWHEVLHICRMEGQIRCLMRKVLPQDMKTAGPHTISGEGVIYILDSLLHYLLKLEKQEYLSSANSQLQGLQ
jgi:hypothetical protein